MTEEKINALEDEELDVITLVDDDNNETEFTVLDVLEVEGVQYAVLAQADCDEDDEEAEALIFKFIKDENGEDMLVDIEDDDEWEKVADIWQESLEENVED